MGATAGQYIPNDKSGEGGSTAGMSTASRALQGRPRPPPRDPASQAPCCRCLPVHALPSLDASSCAACAASGHMPSAAAAAGRQSRRRLRKAASVRTCIHPTF
jgi:hypothetical protein